MDGQKSPGKSFDISKREVWDAYEVVKANKGAAGVDEVSIAAFEEDLKDNLYKIWNRMSSGTYFPPPVRAVEIPKADGGVRVLGIPTVADRIAQTVVARRLEQRVEQIFHPDSYGYRPGRSAHDALRVCQQRCWRYDWVIDLDIEKFFDTVDHDLMIKAVEANTDQRWVVLYVKRWLVAPLALPDGSLQQRDRGTPQGSAVSPVLANLFLHYTFDTWMAQQFPAVPFERYVDDAVVHCVSEDQAHQVRQAIADRMEQVGLRLHPTKTRIVYCRDGNRRGTYPDALLLYPSVKAFTVTTGQDLREHRARVRPRELLHGDLDHPRPPDGAALTVTPFPECVCDQARLRHGRGRDRGVRAAGGRRARRRPRERRPCGRRRCGRRRCGRRRCGRRSFASRARRLVGAGDGGRRRPHPLHVVPR